MLIFINEIGIYNKNRMNLLSRGQFGRRSWLIARQGRELSKNEKLGRAWGFVQSAFSAKRNETCCGGETLRNQRRHLCEITTTAQAQLQLRGLEQVVGLTISSQFGHDLSGAEAELVTVSRKPEIGPNCFTSLATESRKLLLFFFKNMKL